MEICGCHLGLDLLFFFPMGLGHQAFYRYSFVSFNVGLGKSLFLKQVKEESWDWMCPPCSGLSFPFSVLYFSSLYFFPLVEFDARLLYYLLVHP